MRKVLIVESPAKGKKIQSFFKDDTICIASYGHIRDLDPKCMSIDVDRDFTPCYKISEGKSKICKTIQDYARNCEIIMAADDDREGDAIAWHCGQIANLDFTKHNRIIFHEISVSAINKSLQEIHSLNMNSVNAQQARRIIDRLVGYSLSPLLWKHIQTNVKGLSAGRVQSTLLSILKDHEDTISEFKGKVKPSCQGTFKFKQGEISGNSKGTFHPTSPYDPEELLQTFSRDRVFKISQQTSTIEKQHPPRPLITSSLQQSSQKELRFSIKKTMDIAQKLYETGKITYMRTDSPNVSTDFQKQLCGHIKDTWSSEYYQSPVSGKKVKGAQEAHECIRVTHLDDRLHERYTEDDKKLYGLIKRYTITSHMKPALHDVLKLHLMTGGTIDYGEFLICHKTLQYKGFLIYYDGTEKEYSLESKVEVAEETPFYLQTSKCTYEEEKPPSHHDESSIVKKLESSGIGRPSTYASIISTLYTRNYTEVATIPGKDYETESYTLQRNDDILQTTDIRKTKPQKRKIVLTELGNQVLHYLSQHFSHVLNVSFTSQVESDLDLIHEGRVEWVHIVRKVYDSFIKDVQIQRSLCTKTKTSFKDHPKPRLLGEYLKEPIHLHIGPYGPYLKYKQQSKTLKYYLQKSGKSVDQIVLEDILDIVKYPLLIGTYKQHALHIHMGPHGKYLKYNNRNYRIPQKEGYTLEECVKNIM